MKEKEIESERMYQKIVEMEEDIHFLRNEVTQLEELVVNKDLLLNCY